MKALSLKLLSVLLVIGVAFTSCNDDDDYIDPNVLENVDIIIDNNQTFNMTMFAMSFEQLFGSDARWMWDYSHDIQNGKAVTSYQNLKIAGKFGEKVFIISHDFNNEGAITSSTRITSSGYHGNDVTFTYLYDNEGRIVELTKTKEGNVRDIVELDYNSNNQLVKKTHVGGDNFDDGDEELFTYNTDGTIKRYENVAWSQMANYTYTNGNMTRQELDYGGNIYVQVIDYDANRRVIGFYEEDNVNNKHLIEYFEDFFREKEYYDYDGASRLYEMSDYSAYEVEIKEWDFYYSGPNFNYSKAKEYYYEDNHDDQLVSKKEYSEGTPENLILVGYVVVDERDPSNDYKKTKESIYDADGTLLYYITYELYNGYIDSHQVYLPDGTPIDDSDMDDLMWMEILISNINIT